MNKDMNFLIITLTIGIITLLFVDFIQLGYITNNTVTFIFTLICGVFISVIIEFLLKKYRIKLNKKITSIITTIPIPLTMIFFTNFDKTYSLIFIIAVVIISILPLKKE